MKTKPFSILRNKMTPERRAKIDARVQLALLHLQLLELRKFSGDTEEDIEKDFNRFESAVSELESLGDISVLSRYIQSLGGNLQLVAHFPDKEIVITEFGQAGDQK
jgi:hypothetical protein